MTSHTTMRRLSRTRVRGLRPDKTRRTARIPPALSVSPAQLRTQRRWAGATDPPPRASHGLWTDLQRDKGAVETNSTEVFLNEPPFHATHTRSWLIRPSCAHKEGGQGRLTRPPELVMGCRTDLVRGEMEVHRGPCAPARVGLGATCLAPSPASTVPQPWLGTDREPDLGHTLVADRSAVRGRSADAGRGCRARGV